VSRTALASPDEPEDAGHLEIVRYQEWLGRGWTTEVRWVGRPQTLAQVGYELVAAMLAEPLRRALRQHMDEHGCMLFGCTEARRLWELLPDGDRILLA
jgi:hypothetical protein